MAEEHAGFANTVSDGEFVDAREVDAFNDESEAGKIRTASQTTKSSITQFKTEGKSTNGAPAAVVAPSTSDTGEDDVEVVEEAGGQEANEE